jgi:preprotein translocase subunit SecG
MLSLILIIGLIAAALMIIIVLIQNPKGGGLSSSFGGVGNQLMGVKQTTDVLEKGTWIFSAVVGLLCLLSPAFIPKESANKKNGLIDNISTSGQKSSTPNNTGTMPVKQP